jgi:hypothetical protein
MAEKYDAFDIEAVQEVTRSRGYEVIVERIRAVHAAKIKELRDSKLSHEQTQALRGFLDGIDRCLAVPDALKAEWDGRKGRA